MKKEKLVYKKTTAGKKACFYQPDEDCPVQGSIYVPVDQLKGDPEKVTVTITVNEPTEKA